MITAEGRIDGTHSLTTRLFQLRREITAAHPAWIAFTGWGKRPSRARSSWICYPVKLDECYKQKDGGGLFRISNFPIFIGYHPPSTIKPTRQAACHKIWILRNWEQALIIVFRECTIFESIRSNASQKPIPTRPILERWVLYRSYLHFFTSDYNFQILTNMLLTSLRALGLRRVREPCMLGGCKQSHSQV